MSSRYRIYAAVGLGLALLLVGGFQFLGPSSSSSAAPPITPLHHVKKTAAKPVVHRATAKRIVRKPAARKRVVHAKAAVAPPKVAKKTDAATDGMPAELSTALSEHVVVVVSLVVPDAPVDEMAYQEAKAGAARAHAGFVRISASSNDDVQALSTLVGASAQPGNRLLDTPAVLVFRQPHDLYVRINGYVDADTITQAAANAAPIAPVQSGAGDLASAWVTKANAACTELHSQLVDESFPTNESDVLPFLRKLVDTVKATVDKIRAVKPPRGKEARVAAMLAAYDRLFKGVYAQLSAAQHHQVLKIAQLQTQVQRDSQLGDRIAAELGATACSGTGG